MKQKQEKSQFKKQTINKAKDLRREWGERGEAEALCYLQSQGFQLEQKNWKVRSTLDPKKRIQIDLVVSKENYFYIVEVKKHVWKSTGFERLISEDQRKRLLLFTYSLQRLRFRHKNWGFILVWVEQNKAKILERFKCESFC